MPRPRKKRAKQTEHDRYFTTWQSVLQCIAATSAAWTDLETGGYLYGLWTHAGRAVVLFASSPGPNAVHEATHFAQDVDHFKRVTRFLQETYGIQLVGRWHSHYSLGLDHLSSGDERTIQSLSQRNDLSRLVEIIVTHERGAPRVDRSAGLISTCMQRAFNGAQLLASRARPRPDQENTIVRINSFHHTDPQAAEYERCPIKTIPGISPVGLTMSLNDLLNGAGPGVENRAFPMNRLLFDPHVERDEPTTDIPEHIAQQVAALPESILEDLSLHIEGEVIILSLSLSSWRILIAYDATPPHEVRSVGLTTPEQCDVRDISCAVLPDGPQTVISTIYARAESLVHHGKTKCTTDLPKQDGRDEASRATGGRDGQPGRGRMLEWFGRYL
ncbi:MAG: hypothetical protein J5J06_15775 [Phycisphaerae bacterium]|nr:hypothetical protein [Phycisphaerae bacterium]